MGKDKSQSQNDPARHHFVPSFYLKYWHDPATKKLWRYRRDPTGRIASKQLSARSVGFAWNLYTLKADGVTVHGTDSPNLETNFFSPLDNNAGLIQKKLISKGVAALTQNDRKAWALFANSLLERSPDRLKQLLAEHPSLKNDVFTDIERHIAASERRPALQKLLSTMNKSAFFDNSFLGAVVQEIKEPKFLDYVAGMNWVLVDLPIGDDHFMTSDTPVVVNAGAPDKAPIHSLAIALSPQKLMIMYNAALSLETEHLVTMANTFNVSLVAQTKKSLISSRELKNSVFISYVEVVDTLLDLEATLPTLDDENILSSDQFFAGG